MNLNKGKVESRRKGDCFDKVGVVRVIIGSGNCRMLPHIQARDCLSERCVTEIGVHVVGAILTPKTGVHGEFGEVGQPSLFGRPCCYTTWQGTEMRANQEIEVRGVGTFRFLRSKS